MQLAAKQGGVCPLCGGALDFSIKGNKGDSVVVDHDHITGRIRGALHRSCNGGEGKVASAAGRWIVGSMQDSQKIAQALHRVADYLEQEPTELIYHSHKSDDDKREIRAARERKRRAEIKARRAAALMVK
ncbi:putative DNA endonuclease [Erwinia phage Loshitsa2]|uniref:DNA endonuclease n=2 Tax=Micantvirus TaxID=3424950 RepID=A0AAE9JUQ7_9CAUD|nr:putative DNA endonuclease [Erwinia phage Micant]UNA01158.1 putative DNA endonuclease [Erwinia phage Loshitsa2]